MDFLRDKPNNSVGFLDLLCTKDGRVSGNAVIHDVNVVDVSGVDITLYTVVTDMGNRMIMQRHEINTRFHPSKYRITPDHFAKVVKFQKALNK